MSQKSSRKIEDFCENQLFGIGNNNIKIPFEKEISQRYDLVITVE